MNRQLSIRMNALPPRARRLDDHELARVFGGCVKDFESCTADCDCCSSVCMPDYKCAAIGSSSAAYAAYAA